MEGPRGTKKEEFWQLIELVNLVFRPETRAMKEQYQILFSEENLENLRVIVEEGRPVSHIGTLERDIEIQGCRSRVGLVGAVCTHPDYRGRGYATLLLNDCIKRFEEHGCDFMLVSGIRRLYDSADCLLIGNVYRLEIRERDLWRFEKNNPISLSDSADEHLEDMIKAYEEKKVKFIRPRKDWEIALKSRFVMDAPCEFLVIKEEEKFRGYLIVRVWEEGRMAEVREYAGDKKAIIDSVPYLFERYGLASLTIPVPWEDRELAKQIQDKGVFTTIVPIPGTVRLLNFSRLMERMRPYLRERIGEIADRLRFEEKEEKYSISLDGEELVIEGRRAITWVILSRPGGYEIVGEGKLLSYLREILPIPFVWYGINYI
ncbi:MAG: GNAT family N-acetyltransferase [bacterium]